MCLSLVVSLWSKECGDENHQTWVTGGGAVIQLPRPPHIILSAEEVVFREMSLALRRTGRNRCPVSKNNRCSLHLARVCSPNTVLVVRGSLWLHMCFWFGSSRNCGCSRVWAYCQGGMDCLNLDLYENVVKVVLCIWLTTVRPDAPGFNGTAPYICRTEISLH